MPAPAPGRSSRPKKAEAPLVLRRVALSKLKAAPYNPRAIDEEASAALGRSLDEFGLVQPIIWNRQTGHVVGGHQRLMKMRERGVRATDVVEVDWPLEKEKAANVALNSPTLAGHFTDDLAGLLDELERGDGELFHALRFDGLRDLLDELDDEPRPGGDPTKLSERFGVPPFSVLDSRQGYWRERKRAWLALGIRSEEGRNAPPGGQNRPAAPGDYELLKSLGLPNHGRLTAEQQKQLANAKRRRANGQRPYVKRGAAGVSVLADEYTGGDILEGARDASVFDPVLCEIAYRWFCPGFGRVLDVFAGGSVRGIVAGRLGYEYTGIELRPEQVASNRAQLDAIETSAEPRWIEGDARAAQALAGPDEYDLVFSCPPYGDLEQYSADPRDLSNMKHADFVKGYRAAIAAGAALLKRDRFAVFVVGDYRDSKTGIYRNFVAETVAAFAAVGLQLYNEAILVNAIGSAALRAGKLFTDTRKLCKIHQNVLVFVKGDPKAATQACQGPMFAAGELQAQDEDDELDPEPEL